MVKDDVGIHITKVMHFQNKQSYIGFSLVYSQPCMFGPKIRQGYKDLSGF